VPSDRDNERIDHTATEAVHRPGWGRYPGHPAGPYLARTNLPRTCSRSARLAGRGDPRSGLPPHGIQLITGTADFIRHFPPMSAAGTRQHPQQGPCSPVQGVGVTGEMAAAHLPGPPRDCFGLGGCEDSVVRPWQRSNEQRYVAVGLCPADRFLNGRTTRAIKGGLARGLLENPSLL
jgi:hypothetical protein